MPEVATKRKAPAAKEEPTRSSRGRPKADKTDVGKPSPAKKAAPTPVADGQPKPKRGRGRPPKDGIKAKPKKLKYPGKGRGRPKATDVPVQQSDDDE